MSAKTKQLWETIRTNIEAGQFPPVFVTAAGKLALDGGEHAGAELPAAIAALYPAEIQAAAQAKFAAKQAAESVERERLLESLRQRDENCRAVQQKYRHSRCWRLAGLYVDDLSTDRYTWAEIAAWLDWDSYNLRHARPEVSAVCERPADDGGEFTAVISQHFEDCENRNKVVSFDRLAARLREYTEERRAAMAPRN